MIDVRQASVWELDKNEKAKRPVGIRCRLALLASRSPEPLECRKIKARPIYDSTLMRAFADQRIAICDGNRKCELRPVDCIEVNFGSHLTADRHWRNMTQVDVVAGGSKALIQIRAQSEKEWETRHIWSRHDAAPQANAEADHPSKRR